MWETWPLLRQMTKAKAPETGIVIFGVKTSIYSVSSRVRQWPGRIATIFQSFSNICGELFIVRFSDCTNNHEYNPTPLPTEMNIEIQAYNDRQESVTKEICGLLATAIACELKEAESKIWHAHPVWFLDGNPIVGYSKRKDGVQLLFGADRVLKKKN